MQIGYKIFCCWLVFTLLSTTNFSQDLRSGEIMMRQIYNYTYRADIYLYQDSAAYIKRKIKLYWGDNTMPDTLSGGISGYSNTGVTLSRYVGTHTYAGPGNYIISCSDSFLVPNISNINNSINEKLYLEHRLVINPFWGLFHEPVFLSTYQDVEWSCCNWIHNPGALALDADSLSYNLVPWYTSNYIFPPATVTGGGDFTMSPLSIGIYAVAIQIDEWRKVNNQYYNIGHTTRYMLLNVSSLSGVNELINGDSSLISVFPNPTNGFLNVYTDFSNNRKISLHIYNILGEEVYSLNFKPVQEKIIQIDVGSLSEGIYFYRLVTEKASYGKKLVVIK